MKESQIAIDNKPDMAQDECVEKSEQKECIEPVEPIDCPETEEVSNESKIENKAVLYYPQSEFAWLEEHMEVKGEKILLKEGNTFEEVIDGRILERVSQLCKSLNCAEERRPEVTLSNAFCDYCVKDVFYELLSFYYGQKYKSNANIGDSIGSFKPISAIISTHSSPDWRALLENTKYAELVGKNCNNRESDEIDIPNLEKYLIQPYFTLKLIYECYFAEKNFDTKLIDDALYWIAAYCMKAYEGQKNVFLFKEQWLYFGCKLFGENFEDFLEKHMSEMIRLEEDSSDDEETENDEGIANEQSVIDEETSNDDGEPVYDEEGYIYYKEDYVKEVSLFRFMSYEQKVDHVGKLKDEDRSKIYEAIIQICAEKACEKKDPIGEEDKGESRNINNLHLYVPQYMDLVYTCLYSNAPMKPDTDAWSRGKKAYIYDGKYSDNTEFVEVFCRARNLVMNRNVRNNSNQYYNENYRRFKRKRTDVYKKLYREEGSGYRNDGNHILHFMEACICEKVFGFQLIRTEAILIQYHLERLEYDYEKNDFENDLEILGDELKYIFSSEGTFSRILLAAEVINDYFKAFDDNEHPEKKGQDKEIKRRKKMNKVIEAAEKKARKKVQREKNVYSNLFALSFKMMKDLTIDSLKTVLIRSPETKAERRTYKNQKERLREIDDTFYENIKARNLKIDDHEVPNVTLDSRKVLEKIEKWVMAKSFDSIDFENENVEIATHAAI